MQVDKAFVTSRDVIQFAKGKCLIGYAQTVLTTAQAQVLNLPVGSLILSPQGMQRISAGNVAETVGLTTKTPCDVLEVRFPQLGEFALSKGGNALPISIVSSGGRATDTNGQLHLQAGTYVLMATWLGGGRLSIEDVDTHVEYYGSMRFETDDDSIVSDILHFTLDQPSTLYIELSVEDDLELSNEHANDLLHGVLIYAS